MEEQEKRVRKKNIVVTGLDEEECENEKKLEKWMKAELEVEVRVKEMYKINGGKMIVAELESWGEKRKVMENKRKLREKKGKRVYIVLPPGLLVVKLRPLWVPVIGAMSLIVPGSGTLTRLKSRALTC
ncbi:hypothetical protein MTP99_014223 [Tenebrio molitor]|nr:hypothetical protein MTP99_014223 [Tenebrio molitor]